MEASNACPHHGFDTWLLVSYFYDDMSSSMKQLLEMMCGGDFMSKNPEEAMDFLSYVAEIPIRKQNLAMARRLEELEVTSIRKVQAISDTPVQAKSSQSFEHLVEECPMMPIVREMFGDRTNVIGQFKPNKMLHMATLTIQIGGTTRISLGSQGHLSTCNLAKHPASLKS
ncbi:hypothetical protein CK203_059254 [Vitis vinifera]|uniref:Uncharacterized protein n=1 Tax=Vitis vinifera TaxID=29760 RepID=A0A438GEC9_VITVI|nr:hypothetical protein CK203_059254 [Vitis vinifera]